MSKITPTTITNTASTSQVNSNFSAIATELNAKVLYRDNPAGEPNSMQNDLDMNSNDILNAASVQASSLQINGVLVTAANSLGEVPASGVTYVNTTSGLTATHAQAAIDEVEGRLDTAESTITAQTSNIATNAANIATNTADISALETESVGVINYVAAISGGPGTTPMFPPTAANIARGVTVNTTGSLGFTITKTGVYRVDLFFGHAFSNTIASTSIANIFVNGSIVQNYEMREQATGGGVAKRSGSVFITQNLSVGDVINVAVVNNTHALTATAYLAIQRIGDTV